MGYAPGLPAPRCPISVLAPDFLGGIPSATAKVLVCLPTCLLQGGVATRHENACLLNGQDLDHHCCCPPKTLMKFQETGGTVTHPLHVLHSLQWHQPSKGEPALCSSPHPGLSLLDCHATWCCSGRGLRLGDQPVKVQENTALPSDCCQTGTSLHVSLSGLGGKECSICVHSVDDGEVGLSRPLLAELQFVDCGSSALFSWARNCTNHPDLSHIKMEANAGRLLAEEPNQPPRIIWISGWRIIRCLKAAPSSKQAYGTKQKRGGACFTLTPPLIIVQSSNQSLYPMFALLHGQSSVTRGKQCACCIRSNKNLYVYTLLCESFFQLLNSVCLRFSGSMRGISTFFI